MNPIISFENVSFSYTKDKQILNNISFALESGKSLAIIGESGLGKTTILRLIEGLILPTSGKINVFEKDITKLSKSKRRELRRKDFGLIFQTPHLIPELNVIENVVLPAIMNKIPKDIYNRKAKHLLNQFKVDHEQNVESLSGGQASRVGVARALINDPKIIIADEPTASLDEKTANKVISLILEQCEKNYAVIIVTHNMKIAKRCDNILHLKASENGAIAVPE